MARSNAAYFGIGAVAGSAVTALFFLFKEGLMFVGDGISPALDDTSEKHETTNDSEERPVPFKDVKAGAPTELVAYHNMLHENEYKTEVPEIGSAVLVISEEDYFEGGRDGTYDMQALTLYFDGVLADSSSDRVMDASDQASILGPRFDTDFLLKEFKKGVDILYIRNERLLTQYEISYDDRMYEEVTGQVAYG